MATPPPPSGQSLPGSDDSVGTKFRSRPRCRVGTVSPKLTTFVLEYSRGIYYAKCYGSWEGMFAGEKMKNGVVGNRGKGNGRKVHNKRL